MINGYGCYIIYLAVKSHFSEGTYDYFKYNGRVRANEMSFNKRNDRYFFEKLSKKLHTKEEVEKFFVANAVESPNMWIGEINDGTSFNTFLSWNKKIESITYTFSQDLKTILESSNNFMAACQIDLGQHPPIIKFYKQKKITIETITILDILLSCCSYWDVNIIDRIVWPKINRTVQKYKPFVIKNIGQPKIVEFKTTIKEFLID